MKKTIVLAVCVLFVFVLMSGIAFSAEEGPSTPKEEMIITGIINNAHQLVDRYGQTYDVADTKEGKELENHVGQKVQIKGTVVENEGQRQISVSAYKIIKK